MKSLFLFIFCTIIMFLATDLSAQKQINTIETFANETEQKQIQKKDYDKASPPSSAKISTIDFTKVASTNNTHTTNVTTKSVYTVPYMEDFEAGFPATVDLTGDENPANNIFTNEALMGTWEQTTDIPAEAKTHMGSSVLYFGSHGMLLCTFGGNTNSGNNDEVFVLDFESETWTSTTNLPSESIVGAATQLNDDEIFIHTGQIGGVDSDVCYIYNITTETYTTTASLPAALSWTSATTVNGSVYIAGSSSATLYRYDSSGDTWTTVTGDIPKAVSGGSLIKVGDRLVYVWGLQDGALSGEVYVGEIDETDPDLVTWTTTATACPDLGTHKMTAAPISDNAIIVTSGDTGGWNARPNTYIYNLITDTWTQIEDKPNAVLGYAGGSVIIDNDAYYLTAAGYGAGVNTISEYYVILDINPIAETYAPEIDETNVALDAPVSVAFDVDLTENYSPTITISDGVDNFALGYTLTDNLLEISHNAFDYETTYTVTISEGAFIKETTGGTNNEIVWSFTTLPEPITNYEVTFGVETEDGTITATADGTDIVSGDMVEEGALVVFTAVPDNDYEITDWYVNETAAGSTEELFQIENLVANLNVTVEFGLIDFINEQNINQSVYPNPSKGTFTIEAEGSYNLQVIDLTGKIVLKKEITNTDKIEINQAGVYILSLINDVETINYKVVVK